jgi:hypothetical protein
MARRKSTRDLPKGEECIRPSKMPKFPDWLVYEAVREQASDLWDQLSSESEPIKARKVLEELIINPQMKRVWAELYRIRRDQPGNYFNLARSSAESTAASLREGVNDDRIKANALRTKVNLSKEERDELVGLEQSAYHLERAAKIAFLLPDVSDNPRWSNQDHGVRSFFSQIYRAALDCKPGFASKSKTNTLTLIKVADRLYDLVDELESLELGVANYYAETLRDVAFNCSSDAQVIQPKLAPGLNLRRKGDLWGRAFVGTVANASTLLFGKQLHSTIATIANVISRALGLAPKDYRRETIREMLRSNKIRRMPKVAVDPDFLRKREAELERRSKEFQNG